LLSFALAESSGSSPHAKSSVVRLWGIMGTDYSIPQFETELRD
jgi:hypothetical protein